MALLDPLDQRPDFLCLVMVNERIECGLGSQAGRAQGQDIVVTPGFILDPIVLPLAVSEHAVFELATETRKSKV